MLLFDQTKQLDLNEISRLSSEDYSDLDFLMACSKEITSLREAESFLQKLSAEDKVISILEHTTLLVLGTKESYSILKSRVNNLLKKSWVQKYKKCDPEKLYRQLPKSVLRKTRYEDIIIHQSFYTQDKVLNFFDTVKYIKDRYIVKIKDVMFTGFLLWTAYQSIFIAKFLLVIILGYVFSSVVEYIVHKYLGHGSVKLQQKIRSLGKVGQLMNNFTVEHQVHHGSVSKDYVRPFGDGKYAFVLEKIEKMEKQIIRRGGISLLSVVEKSLYGLSSSNPRSTHLFFLPFSILFGGILISNLSLNNMILNFVSLVTFCYMAQFWITTSTFFHRLLHKPMWQIEEEHPYLSSFCRSRFAGYIARTHKVHHYSGGRCNQNLNPLFDQLIGWKAIKLEQIIPLIKDKGIY